MVNVATGHVDITAYLGSLPIAVGALTIALIGIALGLYATIKHRTFWWYLNISVRYSPFRIAIWTTTEDDNDG